MKSTEKELKATKLLEILSLKKELEQQESELKEYFKAILGIGNHVIGNVSIDITECFRLSLQSKLIEEKHGKDFLKEFMSSTNYVKTTVKKVG